MIIIIYRFLYIVFSIYFLIKSIFYTMYEIYSENNKSGGIAFIVFSVFALIFSSVVIFIR